MNMRLYQYDPWSLLEQFRNEVNRLSEAREGSGEGSYIATSDWAPAVDIVERDDRFVLLADVPGIDPKEIEIDMDNGVLSIRGTRSPEEQESESFKRIERPRGNFYRRFTMPDTADAEKVTARSRNGVLEITIPKHEKVQPRRIAVEQ